MTITEDRLTAALNARADQVQPEDLGYDAAPAVSTSRWPVPRAAVLALGAAAAAAAIAAPFVLARPAEHSRPQPGHHLGSTSPSPKVHPDGNGLSVEVFYARSGTGSLVSRGVQIPQPGSDPVVRALGLAAEDPTEPGLTAVVPAHVVSGSGFDGFGRYGSFSLDLSDPAWVERPAGMGDAEARLAQRALVCTVESFGGGGVHGGHQPIHLYLPSGAAAGNRLFGIPLPPTKNNTMKVACP
jgi:hypothetical protein